EVPSVARAEGGLLGLALHPRFAETRAFYIYYTASDGNRVERWRLAPDATSASRERVLLQGIPRARFHDGGFLAFGPDGMLYVGHRRRHRSAARAGPRLARRQDPPDHARGERAA